MERNEPTPCPGCSCDLPESPESLSPCGTAQHRLLYCFTCAVHLDRCPLCEDAELRGLAPRDRNRLVEVRGGPVRYRMHHLRQQDDLERWTPKEGDVWPAVFYARRRGSTEWSRWEAGWMNHSSQESSTVVTGFAAVYAGNYEFLRVVSPSNSG